MLENSFRINDGKLFDFGTKPLGIKTLRDAMSCILILTHAINYIIKTKDELHPDVCDLLKIIFLLLIQPKTPPISIENDLSKAKF